MPLPAPSSLPPATAPGSLSSTEFGATGFDLAAAPRSPGGKATVAIDTCHVGVVLRAVLVVHAVVGIGVLFGAKGWADWLMAFATGAAVSLPATLLWLVLVCAGKSLLHRMPLPAQWLSATGLGALSGLYGWQQLHWIGLFEDPGAGWLAPLLAGAGLAAGLFLWLLLRARQQRPADVAARLAELQSRIRPHFLFNTLNTAAALVRVDPERAEAVLDDLAELFRGALAETGSDVTLAQEVTLAQRYLDIEQVRFGDRLQVEWDLDPAAGAARVPPLLLQPLVENAVRHGVEPAVEGGRIRVRTQVWKGHAVITVVNSVPAGESTPGHGIALRNVRERLALMHDVAARFETRLEAGRFKAQLVVPLPGRT